MKYIPKKPKVGRLSETKTSGGGRFLVTPARKGWIVKNDTGSARGASFRTQAEALLAAQQMLRKTGGEVHVKDRKGRFRNSFTIGRIGFERISAVEGIALTVEMKRDLKEFDRKRLSPAKRRSALIRKYGGKLS